VASNISHFAINADDIGRARQFYESVFGWKFAAWGPPDFFQITTGDADDPGVRGALQRRRELAPGLRLNSFEPTFAVADVDATAAALRANGARILMERTTIGGVGHLIFFQDTEGNVAGAMQYDAEAE
jgi:predicted enzyme related to lactoylglutathione lyase